MLQAAMAMTKDDYGPKRRPRVMSAAAPERDAETRRAAGESRKML